MKQRFSKRTRLVSALLTLAMVFTFLPFSAFAASYDSIENIAFTTNGCDALQIKEGASVNDWLESFKEIMSKQDESLHPLVEVKDLGFSIADVTTFSVCTREGNTTTTFIRDKYYFLQLSIYAGEGRMFKNGVDFKSVKIDGVEMTDSMCYHLLGGSSSNVAIIRLPLSFQGTHKLKDHPKKLPNCTTPGTEYYSECTKCGKLFKEIDGIEKVVTLSELSIPALGHEEDEVNWGWDRTGHYPLCKRCHIQMPGSASIPHFYKNGGHTCITCGYTWKEIEKVKIFVTEPAAGVSADSPAISYSPELYSATCQWFHNHHEFTGTFEEGETYTLQVTVKSIGMGYKFVKGTTYNVNGNSVGRMPMYGVSNEGPWDSVTLSSIEFVAKSEAESTEINSIYLTIPAPEAGKTAEEWEDKAQKTDSRYRVRLYWAEVDDAGNVLSDLSTGKFVEGKRYRVCAELYTKTGYYFPNIQNQIAVINGEEIAAEKNPYGQNNTQWRNYFAYLTAVPGGSTGGGTTGGGTTGGGSTGGGTTIPGTYQLTVTDGVATVNGSTGTKLDVEPGATVTLTADTTKFPEDDEFGWWEISPYGSVSNTLTGQYQRTATFKMPPENVSARAMSKSAGVSTGGDGGGGGAIIVVAGAAAVGLAGYGIYNYVAERQLKALLPEGVAMPENRAQTALLLWNTAGRPEPAEAPAFKDVADPDTAKAAQWCVEHGLMNVKLRGRFAPDGSSPAYKTLNAYRQLVG